MAAALKSSRAPAGNWPPPAARGAPRATMTEPPDATADLPTPGPEVMSLRRGHGNGDMIGVAWVHGSLHLAAFRRQTVTGTWEAPRTVTTLSEFAAALDEALLALQFAGTEIFFILAHDEFVHQAESAPSFAERAAQHYLRGRVSRLEQERAPLLWVSQRAAAMKKEAHYILHLLPVAFYHRLNELLLTRRLELTRILPLHIPLQLALSSLTETRDMPLLVATGAGSSTAVLVGRTGSDILFARTILESWRKDPARVAVEINRSLLYAKQQFGTNVDFVWLLGRDAEEARAEVVAKCAKDTEVVVEELGPVDWLKAVVRLSPGHPVNLVGRFLRRKRRARLARRAAVAAAWLGLAWLGLSAWSDAEAWSVERARLAALRADEPAMRAEHDRLTRRNAAVARDQAFVQTVVDDRLPPVPATFVRYVATVLPREAGLNNFQVKWSSDAGAWEFRCDGTIQADAETAAAMLAALRREITGGPFRARLTETVRRPSAMIVGGDGTAQSFFLEGSLFAD